MMKWLQDWRDIREWARTLESSDFGRNFGWWVERDGKVICSLDDPQFTDSFWTSYRVTSENGTPLELLRERSFWFNEHLHYRNRRFDRYAPNAFASIGREEGRICLRGDYLQPEDLRYPHEPAEGATGEAGPRAADPEADPPRLDQERG